MYSLWDTKLACLITVTKEYDMNTLNMEMVILEEVNNVIDDLCERQPILWDGDFEQEEEKV